ncbi:hypothetical protein AB0G67_27260 [Streptomyces sp. NPDC021056]|uniref:hypothetical protein n=1 Tax=Streptomyces sp. NPDC021056 TaxID=3155012 RepID=UPI0033F4CF23
MITRAKAAPGQSHSADRAAILRSRDAQGQGGNRLDKFYAAVAGGFVMLLLTPVIQPLAKRLEEISRRIYRVKPIHIHIERDPTIVWAGFPNWIGTSVWLPEHPNSSPPEHPTDWHAWARTLGGADANLTVLKITITSRELASVVVDTPKVRSEQLPLGDPPKGVIATQQTGGAAIDPRRIQVDLDMPYSMWVNPHGEPLEILSLNLSPGETEQFYLYASASVGRHKWHLELPILVDGKRQVIRIDDDGQPFMTYGTEGFENIFWQDGTWKVQDPI